MRVISHDWERRRWIVVHWDLYIFSFVFLYAKYIRIRLSLSWSFSFICVSRASCRSYIQILRSFPPFFMYTSALSSFRRRRVRGLISISFYTYPTSHAGKIKLVRIDESRGLNFISSMSHYTYSSIVSSQRFRSPNREITVKDHAFRLYVTITFGLAMREFLFNEKQ